jgi:hypothetical protein
MADADVARTGEPDAPLDRATREQVIDGVLRRVGAEYVFPDVGRQIAAAVRARAKRGEYDRITSTAALARALTEHVREVNHDRHLRVEYVPDVVPPDHAADEAPDAASSARMAEFEREVNHGVDKVERLDGNVGYVELRGFFDPATAGPTAAAAMTLLADTDALVIDLRRNGGGDPAMVAFVASYVFDEAVHLNDLYWRPTESTGQFWTQAYVPGKRFGAKKPVYVLTSHETFSAAEELAYDLQAQKRATVVGETSGGGAHPGDFHRLADHFRMFVPCGRAINPRTHTNWEGTGVKPDVAVAADAALLTAHAMALDEEIKTASPARADELRQMSRDVRAKLDAARR